MIEWIGAILLLLMILGGAYYKKSLTRNATILAFFMGVIIYFSGGYLFLCTLFFFFISSSILTKIGDKDKVVIEQKLYEKNGERDVLQVIANGIVPTLCAILYTAFSNENFWQIAYFVSIAASTADTWASEIGILSKASVRSSITFKQVKKGLSGGITLMGLFSSLLGASSVALIYLFFLNADVLVFIFIIVCGFIAAYFDSIIGEVIQVKYKNKQGELTEVAKDNKKVSGISFVNNDVVNIISSIFSVFLLFLFYTVFI